MKYLLAKKKLYTGDLKVSKLTGQGMIKMQKISNEEKIVSGKQRGMEITINHL